ncbi:hypothetical protein B5807_11885 [Epicoccum nigrum]|uniref:Uncharacterized protein n=1 Tax=Epicoccum nigrum TaxID=105696 RepID=A0A1Y2LIG5_EPING|nr:hypothetical protein B5807_11885 [Epicoccum nigrum]
MDEAIVNEKPRQIRVDQAVIVGVRESFRNLENRVLRAIYNERIVIRQLNIVTERCGVGVGEQMRRRVGWSMIRGAAASSPTWWCRGYAPREAPTPASMPNQASDTTVLRPD